MTCSHFLHMMVIQVSSASSVFSFTYLLDFPGGLDGKASGYNAGDLGSIPGLGRSPAEGNGNPLQYSCLEKPMDGRSLIGYSPWGHKQSDMTKQLHFLSLDKNSTVLSTVPRVK